MTAGTSPSEVAVRRYVAMGDSFSSGIGEPGEVPWPQAVADRMGEDTVLHNLAVAGAASDHVVEHQLPRALHLRPELVSVVCGANDVLLHVRPDLDACVRNIDLVLDSLARLDPAPLVVCATYPEAGRFLDLRPRTRRRVRRGLDRVNEAVRAAADRHGALCLEWEGRDREAGRGHYAADGLHPSPLGHRRAADAFTRALEGHL
ncbi:MAG TPA: GDSL-type esterase/lipase family protein [Thermoleophilaceae bacterium]|nr:GDSL-type esterase/lipase family protein [Thermoleophilaceae bacterium]